MEFSADQIASMLGGTVEGNGSVTVHKLSKIEEGEQQSLTFLANPKYTEHIYSTAASIVIVGNDFSPEKQLPSSCTLIKVDDAYGAFAKLLEAYDQFLKPQPGIAASAIIHETAFIGENVFIGDFVTIAEDVKIGDNCSIASGVHIGKASKVGSNCSFFSGAQIYRETIIGNNCTIHSGTIIGADGFGFAPSNTDGYKKVPQIGNVILEDDVEIGANACVDRATLGSTIIRKGVKLDNLVQIAHNVEIGDHTVIAAQTGVAGSTKIGKNCMIGGQVGITGHITIADGCKIAAQSGVGNSIKVENSILQGSPAMPIGDFKRSYVLFKGLPQMRTSLQKIEKKLTEIFENLAHE